MATPPRRTQRQPRLSPGPRRPMLPPAVRQECECHEARARFLFQFETRIYQAVLDACTQEGA